MCSVCHCLGGQLLHSSYNLNLFYCFLPGSVHMQQFARDPSVQRLFLAYAESRPAQGGVLCIFPIEFLHACY